MTATGSTPLPPPDEAQYQVDALPLQYAWGVTAIEHAYAIWRLLSPRQRQDYAGFRVLFTEANTQFTLIPREPPPAVVKPGV